MARGNTRTRRSSTRLLLTVGIILVAGVALVTTLVLVDAIRLPFLQKTAIAGGEKTKSHGKDIPVPVCARPIPIFTAVQPQDLADPQTKTIKFSWVDPDKAKEKGFFTQYSDIVGRVLRKDKNPGFAFTEADFYPKGALPTPANAVEQGKLGMYVDPAKIPGLGDLKQGDTFDLMGVQTGIKDANGQKNGTVASSLVTGGKVILALRMQANGRPKPGEQMFIQVTPQEHVDLQSALAAGARISCAARPGIAGVETGPLPIKTPEPAPDTIEILSGKSGSRMQQVPSGTEASSDADAGQGATQPGPPADAVPKKKGLLEHK